MGSNWLEKEEEYRKVNEELQKQNKILMEEFDDVLKKQANRLLESRATVLQKNGCSFVQNKVKFFDHTAKENNYETSNNIELVNIPDSVDQMGIKGMSSFYRAKIKTLQSDNQQLQVDLKNKCEELKKIQKDNNKIVDEKEKWFQAYNTHKVTIGKLEKTENATLRKDMEQTKKEFKHTNLNITGNEVRLNRALEENDKLRNELKTVKQEEKQLKDVLKKEMGELTKRLQQVEKQKGELVTAYKKQIQLIDNLKKQKLYLEGLKIGEMSENEFMKILSWKIE
ncbi:hypothetical protein RI129_002175 [Pyrocoelia pectoralis]|uniref:Uncharacterized protein n=1 Tax=Pyrocoelia pectoralis TaxID=417401 RepID=A0AAN7VLZ1_9COLE